MNDSVRYCDVMDWCEECPRYGNDCDGEGERMRRPYYTQPPSGDLISRADAIRIVDSYIGTDPISDRIKLLPSAEADRPTGEWIDFVSQVEGRFKECDQCGERIYLSTFYENDYNFCPNCGAKMTKGGDSE